MHILHVVGARTELHEGCSRTAAIASRNGTRQTLVHPPALMISICRTYSSSNLGMPAPDINLAVGSRSHAQQQPISCGPWKRIVGAQARLGAGVRDVNSTVAAALVCAKL